MLSNHYSFTYTHPQNWLILIGMMFAGAAIRQFFVMRHGYKLGRNPHPWKYAAVGVVVAAGPDRLAQVPRRCRPWPCPTPWAMRSCKPVIEPSAA